MADTVDHWDIDYLLNLDAMDEEDAAVGGPQQDLVLELPPPVPHAPFIQPDVHAAAPAGLAPAPMPAQHQQMPGGHQMEYPPAAAIQHQQMDGELQAGDFQDLDLDQLLLGDPSAYGFQDHMVMPAAIAHVQDDIQGPYFHPQVPVPAVQHQQLLADASSAYGFQDHMVMPAPIAHVQHDIQEPSFDHVHHHQVLPVTAVQHQQMLGDAAFQDHIMMPAPVGHVPQHDIQGAPSHQVQYPQVPATAVEHQQILGEPPGYGIHGQRSGKALAYGFQDQMPMMPPAGGSDEEPFSPHSSDSLDDMVAEYYLMQEGDFDITADFIGEDQVNHASDEVDFVPLVPGRLQCDHCRVVRKIKCRSETQEQFIFLHSVADGTFEHAILERSYLGDDSQAPRTEQLYINFTGRTPEFVLNFIASRVESLKNEMGGAVEDSDKAGLNSNISTPPIINDSYQQMEIAMLNLIFNPSAQNVEDAQPPPPLVEAAANNNPVDGLPAAPSIFQSMLGVQNDQHDESAELQHSSIPAMQQERMASSTLGEQEETRQYLLELKEKAERELATKNPEMRRFCRSTGNTWKLERIRRLNRRIIEYAENLYMFTLSKLITNRKKADELATEIEQIFAQITGDMEKERKSNDNKAGPSGTKKVRKARARARAPV